MSDGSYSHVGGERPVHPMTIVVPHYRGEADPDKGIRIEGPTPAWRLAWHHDGEDDDIVSYQIVGHAA